MGISQYHHESRLRRPRTHRAPPRQRRGFRPRLEGLEDRTVLSTLTVMNYHDSGTGSLRHDPCRQKRGHDRVRQEPERPDHHADEW